MLGLINHEIRIPINQQGFNGKCIVFFCFFVAQVASLALFGGQDSVRLRGHHFSVAWRCLIAKD